MRPIAVCVGVLLGLFVTRLAAAAESGDDRQGLDEAFLQVAARMPTFGGAYLDGDASVDADVTLFVWLTDPDEDGLAAVTHTLREIVGEPYTLSRAQALLATFSWQELYGWKQVVSGQLVDGGMSYVDIDEQSNRLEVGIDRGADDDEIAKALESVGVPVDAVRFTEAEPFRTLEDEPGESDGFLGGSRPLALAGVLTLVAGGIGAYVVRVLRRRPDPAV